MRRTRPAAALHAAALRAAALFVTAAVTACVTVTTRAFLPSPQNPIYTPANAEPVLSEYLRLQCESLRKAPRADSGTVRFVLDVDTLGFTTRAELERGTGDETLDGVFGTVAAQLALARGVKARRERVDVLYQCAGDDARVTVRTAGQ